MNVFDFRELNCSREWIQMTKKSFGRLWKSWVFSFLIFIERKGIGDLARKKSGKSGGFGCSSESGCSGGDSCIHLEWLTGKF